MSVLDEPSAQWNEEDLVALIDGSVEESLQLEYKRCAALADPSKARDDICNEFSKDVSSFANSAGGTLVYGIIETGHKPTALDDGFDPAVIKKEWLEDVIQGRVHPKIDGLVINPVKLSGTRHGKAAYVISIPQGTTAHQAADKRYYKRWNFKAVPMEDYEIRDVMNRLNHPRLVPKFKRRHIEKAGTVHEYALEITLVNEGPVRVRDLKLVLTIPRVLSTAVQGFVQRLVEKPSSLFGNDWFENSMVLSEWVIFPADAWINLTGKHYRFDFKVDTARYDINEEREPFLFWKTYADDMPPLSGAVKLSEVSRSE